MANREPRRLHPRMRLPPEVYDDPDTAYLITACAFDRVPFLDNATLAVETVKLIQMLRLRRNTRVYAYCLMPDHLHMLLSPALGDNVSRIMHQYKLRTTEPSWQLGHEGKLWQKGFHDRVLRERDSEAATARYILQNPVRAGLVTDAGEYLYSGTPDGSEIGL
jgi:putative transposase